MTSSSLESLLKCPILSIYAFKLDNAKVQICSNSFSSLTLPAAIIPSLKIAFAQSGISLTFDGLNHLFSSINHLVNGCSFFSNGEKSWNAPLILFLTARSEEYSELAGFNAGADDYVVKPIKPKLLISRIQALLRRNKKNDTSNHIKISDIEIEKEKHLLLYKVQEIHLARKEFSLLYYLMTIPGRVFTRQEILSEIWGDTIISNRTIDVHVRRIREKIGDHYIKTIKGIGYKFDI